MSFNRQNQQEYKKHKYSNSNTLLDDIMKASLKFKDRLPKKVKLTEEKQQIIADGQLAMKLQIKDLKIKINEEYNDKANEEKNNYRIERTNSRRQVIFTAYYTGKEPIDKMLGRKVVKKDNCCESRRRNICRTELSKVYGRVEISSHGVVIHVVITSLFTLLFFLLAFYLVTVEVYSMVTGTLCFGLIFLSICLAGTPCRSSTRYEQELNSAPATLGMHAQSEITKRINLLKSKQQETTLIIFNQSRRDSSSEIHIEIKENALVEGNQSSDNSHKRNSEAELNESINNSYDDSSDTEVEELNI